MVLSFYVAQRERPYFNCPEEKTLNTCAENKTLVLLRVYFSHLYLFIFEDRWGGIWEAPRGFTFTADNNKQTNIQLVKKFDNWEYSDSGIEQRMPWISDARLTTSHHAYRSWWGTITGK